MRLAVAITFFYRYSRLKYLRQICEAHKKLGIEYTTFVITNTKERNEISQIRENACNKDLCIATPARLGHPYLLTWSHRDIFREQISSGSGYSHFLYTEDDLLVTRKNLDYWLRAREVTRTTHFVPAFFRYEINGRGEIVSTDVTETQALTSHVLKVGETTFVNLRQPYQGMYLMDKELAIEFLFSDASSPDTGIWGIREKAAQGLTYWNVPSGAYSRMVVGLDERMRIHSDARIHHLPNNYANDPESPHGKLPVDEVLTNQ